MTDTGSGIAPENFDRIFQPFEQTEEGRVKGGTGLGLPISRKYCQLLGGDLLVESEIGKGSRFSFTIRAKPCLPDSLAGNGEEDRIIGVKSGKLPKVLIVDDRETNRDILFRILEPLGFLVAQAQDGREAFDLIDSWKPELLLLDLVMPGISGRDIIQAIRTDPARKDLKIIVITASVLDEEKESVISLGANAFVRKPFREKEVLDEIGLLFGLEYAYEAGGDNTPAPTAFSGDDLVAKISTLPSETLSRLHDSIKLGDLDEVRKIAGEISENDAPLANTIMEMADNYRFGALLEILGSID